jgi:transcriptional regulator with XRE-family HTH domain
MRMESLKLFREKYGFTQEVAAIMLGINHAQLAMAEIGKRSVPQRALEKMARFDTGHLVAPVEKDITKYYAENAKLMKQQYTAEVKALLEYSQETNHRRETIRRKWAPLEKKRLTALNTLTLLVQLRTTRQLNKTEMLAVCKTEADARRTLTTIPQILVDKLAFQMEALDIIGEKIDEKINQLNQLIEELFGNTYSK